MLRVVMLLFIACLSGLGTYLVWGNYDDPFRFVVVKT